MQACAPLCAAEQQFNDVVQDMLQVSLDLSELPYDLSFESFVDLASDMPLSHIKLYQLENIVKEELSPSLETQLAGSIATKTITIGPTDFEEIEAQQIAVDIWGCSTPNT